MRFAVKLEAEPLASPLGILFHSFPSEFPIKLKWKLPPEVNVQFPSTST